MAAKKKQESVLGLPPVPQFTPNGSLLAPDSRSFGFKRPLTRAEEATVEEWRHQQLVQLAQTQKTNYGLTKMGEIHEHANATFEETLNTLRAVKNRKRADEEHQARIDEFTCYQEGLLAQCLMAAVETGCTNILVEIGRSLYIEPEPEPEPEQPSVWKLLFG